MMKLRAAIFALLSLIGTQSPGFSEESTGRDKLVIIGDSTACIYEKGMPYRGWGQYLQSYLKENLQVENLARPGRSTKTFMIEGSWKRALKMKPKFVLIQFGTNDAHDARAKEATDPEVSFRMFLERYVDGALAISAIPVLISPAHPRVFDSQGKVTDVFQGFDLRGYEETMKEVASSRGVAMIDLFSASRELYNKLGKAASAQFDPVQNDKIHFNATAAKAMTELIVRRLVKVEPRIREYMGPQPDLLVSGDQ